MLHHRTNQFLEVGVKGTKDVSVLFKWNINLGTYKYENNSFFGHLLTQRLLHSSAPQTLPSSKKVIGSNNTTLC